MKINSHIAHYKESAQKLGISFGLYAPFNRGMWIMNKRGEKVFFYKSMTPLVRSSSRILSNNKRLANQFLAETDKVNVPEQIWVKDLPVLQKFFEKHQTIVIKPYNGMGGQGVTVLPKESELEQAIHFAREYSDIVIAENYIVGENYRFLVLNGRVISVVHRIPPHIIADGMTTIENQLNDRNLILSQKKIPAIQLSSETLRVLAAQGFTPQSIPAAGTKVTLRLTANLSKGATTVDITETVPEAAKEMAVIAAQTLGLKIAGIDIIAANLNDPQTVYVIEVNAAPGLKMHYLEPKGIARDVATEIIRAVWEE